MGHHILYEIKFIKLGLGKNGGKGKSVKGRELKSKCYLKVIVKYLKLSPKCPQSLLSNVFSNEK